ncbi:unnamed protein product, partial [Rotaria sp. Silwood1]
QQKQILDSATEEQTKNLNQQNEQLEPIIIDNQQQEQEHKSSLSKLQKEPIQKTNISSINEQSSLTSEINEQNNQYNSLNDKSLAVRPSCSRLSLPVDLSVSFCF